MSVAFFRPRKADLSRLREAVQANTAEALGRLLHDPVWEALTDYLRMQKFGRNAVVISQGALDRTVYFVESGVLRVHRGTRNAELQLAVLGPGAVVGEGAFFSFLERNATVQATHPTVLWALSPGEFDRMSDRHPREALSLSMALGAVVATRMLHVAQKISVT